MGESKLGLSGAEMSQIHKTLEADENSMELVNRCWRDILKKRAIKFQNAGLAGLPPYETKAGNAGITVQSEIQSLFNEVPKIKTQILSLPPFASRSSESGSMESLYWELIKINGHATFNLGAIYFKTSNDRYQVLDCNYYCSSETYASLTFRQIWPIKFQGRDVSLIWRVELASSPLLENARGIDRLAARGIMVQEIKDEIHWFQENAVKAP